jgi:hypothetical protein
MKMIQIYETRMMSHTANHEAHFVLVPARSFFTESGAPASSTPKHEEILKELDLKKISSLLPHHLAEGLALLMSPSIDENVERHLKDLCNGTGRTSENADELCSLKVFAKADMEFAENLSFECDLPFENSPLTGEVLVRLVTKATGAGVGAFAGFVAFGASPLLLVTVPAGMILCGAAKGVADALESGLRERLTNYLKGKRSGGKPKGRE